MDASDPPQPPPADTHDSSEPPADVPDHPEPPKKTGEAVKKRKRSLSYKTKQSTSFDLDSIAVIETMGGGNVTISRVEGIRERRRRWKQQQLLRTTSSEEFG
jgi:hypothetical protein